MSAFHQPSPSISRAPSGPAATTTGTGLGPGMGDGPSNRVDVIDTAGGRILCVADVRGAISTLNTLAAEHGAKAIIHSGDFGFYEPASLDRISDRTLRHLVQYSSLINNGFRNQLLSSSVQPPQMRAMLKDPPQGSMNNFAFSEFPKLVTGELKLAVPVYTVWGACEDVAILEKIRSSPPSPLIVPSVPPTLESLASQSPTIQPNATSNYSIPNLTVLDEATTRVLLIGGVRLRLFGLGGAVVSHKLFDNGEGQATIAGGGGTMWTTVLQIGEIVDTAQRVYDATETRLLVTHASPGREGLLAQLALVLKADLTISAGLHFRYGVSYNEFSVQHDQENFRTKLVQAKGGFGEVWETVQKQVEAVIDDNQRKLLDNALRVTSRVPAAAAAGAGASSEEPAWKNTWNWNLPDAAYGSLVLDVREGRVGAEMKSQGFNFAYRQQASRQNSTLAPTPVGPTGPQLPAPSSQQGPTATTTSQQAPSTTTAPPAAASSPAPKPSAPSGPAAQPNNVNPPSGPGLRPAQGPKGRRGPRDDGRSDSEAARTDGEGAGATQAQSQATAPTTTTGGEKKDAQQASSMGTPTAPAAAAGTGAGANADNKNRPNTGDRTPTGPRGGGAGGAGGHRGGRPGNHRGLEDGGATGGESSGGEGGLSAGSAGFGSGGRGRGGRGGAFRGGRGGGPGNRENSGSGADGPGTGGESGAEGAGAEGGQGGRGRGRGFGRGRGGFRGQRAGSGSGGAKDAVAPAGSGSNSNSPAAPKPAVNGSS